MQRVLSQGLVRRARGLVFCGLVSWLGFAVDSAAQLRISISNLPPVGVDLEVTGALTGETHQVEFAGDLLPGLWDPLVTFTSMTGIFNFTDVPSTNLFQRFYRARRLPFPQQIEYSGDTLTLVFEGFTPGNEVQFDIDDNGSFEISVFVDAEGILTAVLDLTPLTPCAMISYRILSDGVPITPVLLLGLVRLGPDGPSRVVPVNTLPVLTPVMEPGICACDGSSLGITYTQSLTPIVHGVELISGKVRQGFPITSIKGRLLDFGFGLHHASLVDYDGPYGRSMSHNYNMMIVRTGRLAGQIITPDLRIFDITSTDEIDWTLPNGFFSRLVLDSSKSRWTLTHFAGEQREFLMGRTGQPSLMTALREPNGNVIRLFYDGSGYLTRIKTALHQEQILTYRTDDRLGSFSDHLGHTWIFAYDGLKRLNQIATPSTEHLTIGPGVLIAPEDLTSFLTVEPRTLTFQYDSTHSDHLSWIIDGRGATPLGYAYDPTGRVQAAIINNLQEQFNYAPLSGPEPRSELDTGNVITRVTDRDNNICDYEMHGANGGPNAAGRAGLRRKVQWTETGFGGTPQRVGEPNFWVTRLLHDCDSLKPAVVVQTFSNIDEGSITFDTDEIPTDWPRSVFTYNGNRQVLVNEYRDDTGSIRREYTYQPSGFGDSGEFSRLSTATDPRQFDTSPINTGLGFEHSYQYDPRGNLVQKVTPTVTRGVITPQTISETWDYNSFGQVVRYEDGNGNVSKWTYHSGGPPNGGSVNSAQFFNGYLNTFTVGDSTSVDAAVNATTGFKVNALGMVTEITDPEGHVYEYEYNQLSELVGTIEPDVTLFNSATASYFNDFLYDAAGNVVHSGRANLQVDGIFGSNTKSAISKSFDHVNNVTGIRAQVDATPANDLITRYAYDGNDQLIVVEKPEGNRTFYTYDERRLPLRTFYGVAPGGSTTLFYPPSDADTTLDPGADPVGVQTYTYDARGNTTVVEDGRANTILGFYDFYNRLTSYSDPNGNGAVSTYDDAGLVLHKDHGSVSRTTGLLDTGLVRTYYRHDEAGRMYQLVLDAKLSTDETNLVDPEASVNSSYTRGFDLSHRLIRNTNARGFDTTYAYDAANRLTTATDAKGSSLLYEYDQNSNPTMLSEAERSEGGPLFITRTYITTHEYDELDRLVETHIRGETGNPIDHVHSYAYDSRHNQVLYTDAEGNVEFGTYDFINRRLAQQRYDGNPITGSATELRRYEWDYDDNSRVETARVRSNVLTPSSIQESKYAYDNLDRLIRTVYPDSDDPIGGGGNGTDGQYDRVEGVYDENSNLTQLTDQRGVVFGNTFDPGNRMTLRTITRPPNVFGEQYRETEWDFVDRLLTAENDYAKCEFVYDPLSRVKEELQSIRLDGTGATSGHEQPIQLVHTYDKDSNRTLTQVREGAVTDLRIGTTYDELNRQNVVQADYLGSGLHDICDYTYFGPYRVIKRTLGNAAELEIGYDTKRRSTTHAWMQDVDDEVLVAFLHGHDKMDNALFEQFRHDGDRYDHFYYNNRYELDAAAYRSATSTPPASPSTEFFYDDNQNRVEGRYSDPFGIASTTIDIHFSNAANEYTTLTRSTVPALPNPVYDRSGNPSLYTLRAPTASTSVTDGSAFSNWDANSRLFDISVPVSGNAQQHYRYDPLGRRIAVLEGGTPTPERRFIWSGWTLLEERLFVGGATVSNAPSALERIYVPGLGLDDDLLCAIDGNADGALGSPAQKNVPLAGADQEFYYLCNRQGTPMAILDADNDERVMEYYRYEVFGSPLVLPVVDANMDGIEDTPLDMTDNAAGAQRGISPYKNFKFKVYFDTNTGLYYMRKRYYDPSTGRFMGRDPSGYMDGLNLYGFVGNNVMNSTDPLGLAPGYLEVPNISFTISEAQSSTAAPTRSGKEYQFYSIELISGSIAGGHEHIHPDFMWFPTSGSAAMFNPKELSLSKSVPWQKDSSGSAGNHTLRVYGYSGAIGNYTVPPTNGDINQPIVIGTMYNGRSAPAAGVIHACNQDLKSMATRELMDSRMDSYLAAQWVRNKTPGGGGNNEIRMQDAKMKFKGVVESLSTKYTMFLPDEIFTPGGKFTIKQHRVSGDWMNLYFKRQFETKTGLMEDVRLTHELGHAYQQSSGSAGSVEGHRPPMGMVTWGNAFPSSNGPGMRTVPSQYKVLLLAP